MDNMNNFLFQTKKFLNRHSSTLLTITGAAGVIGTTVMAVKATPKALQLIEEAKEEKGEDLTKFEVVKKTAPVYLPSVLVGASTIACIFGANILNQRKQAALMSAYALLDNSYKEYTGKTKELYGEQADIDIRDEIVKDKYLDYECETEKEGDTKLFYEDTYGGYFEATDADVLKAEMEVNRLLAFRGYVSINEYFTLLGIKDKYFDYPLGWSCDTIEQEQTEYWLDFSHRKVTLEDGMECTIVSPHLNPLPDFMAAWE